MSEPQPLTVEQESLIRVLAMTHSPGKEWTDETLLRLFATLDAARARIAELERKTTWTDKAVLDARIATLEKALRRLMTYMGADDEDATEQQLACEQARAALSGSGPAQVGTVEQAINVPAGWLSPEDAERLRGKVEDAETLAEESEIAVQETVRERDEARAECERLIEKLRIERAYSEKMRPVVEAAMAETDAERADFDEHGATAEEAMSASERDREMAHSALDVVASRVAERGWMDKPETTHAHTAAFLRSRACDPIVAAALATAREEGRRAGLEQAMEAAQDELHERIIRALLTRPAEGK